MNGIELAGGPVSWGVDFAGDPDNPPPGEVLAGIAAAGLTWTELGPAGFLPAVPGLLEEHGLAGVGGFVFEPLHDRESADAALAAARRALDAVGVLGGRLLVVIDRPGTERAPTAGRSNRAPRLASGRRHALVALVRRIAQLAADRGVRAVVHPHAGGFVEFPDEIDGLLDAIPADELGLCLDTGHALYAGEDPVGLIADYAARLEHVHLKDVNPAVHAAALEDGAGFWDAVGQGVFCPVGDGMLDLAALRSALEHRFAGVATIEQDRRRHAPGSALADLRRSVQRLRAAGIG